jgi:hypothetical protein
VVFVFEVMVVLDQKIPTIKNSMEQTDNLQQYKCVRELHKFLKWMSTFTNNIQAGGTDIYTYFIQ